MNFRGRLVLTLLILASAHPAGALEKKSATPYVGAIVIDAASGEVLFEDNPDARGYPASVTKLMTFAVVMDRVNAGQLTLDSPVVATAEAARTGGSQVYLKQGEVFSLDEMLVALMVSSANDAAVALAIHVAGSREAFVDMMNAKARELGMTQTEFNSPHGLPPGRGQRPDVSTARDLATLSRALVAKGDVLDYSSIQVRMLRRNTANPFEMRNHNPLLRSVAGCDGLKTGFFSAAGFSLSATAERNGRRLIAVVLGSEQRVPRDVKTKELLERSFATLPAAPAAPSLALPAAADTGPLPTVRTDKSDAPAEQSSTSDDLTVKFRVIPPSK